MKRVLIVSENALLCKYLCEKILSSEVQVDMQNNRRSSSIKMMAFHPDLIIFDAAIDFEEMRLFLQDKAQNPETAQIPTVIIGEPIDKKKLSELIVFNVVKYFVLPLKIDLFFDMVGRILDVKIPIDKTSCVIDIHANGATIFIEISRGLNNEKLILMRFRLHELFANDENLQPQIVVIMSNLHLSFIDASNLEGLFRNLTLLPRVELNNIKLLTTDAFTKKLIMGHPLYSKIEILNDFSMFAGNFSGSHKLEDEENDKTNALRLRFLSDFNDDDNIRKNTKIAIIQQNLMDREDLLKALKRQGYSATYFESEVDFLLAAEQTKFDIAILGDEQKGLTAFDVLSQLKSVQKGCDVIVYSETATPDFRKEFLQQGAKAVFEKQNYRCNDVANQIHEFLIAKM